MRSVEIVSNFVSSCKIRPAHSQHTRLEESNLTVQMAALRKALGPTPDNGEWITTVPRIGYRLLRVERQRHDALSSLPALAVLPFVCLGDSAEQEYFADGIVYDIIKLELFCRTSTGTLCRESRSLLPKHWNQRRESISVVDFFDAQRIEATRERNEPFFFSPSILARRDVARFLVSAGKQVTPPPRRCELRIRAHLLQL